MLGTKIAAVGLGLSLVGCASEGAPAPVESYSQASREAAVAQRQQEGFVAPRIGQVILSRDNMCAWSPESPLPQPSSGGVMLVDGRCAYPMRADGDPTKDFFGVYEGPTQESTPVERKLSGSFVLGRCFTIGQPRQDGTKGAGKGRWSHMWVKINTKPDGSGKDGYVPSLITGYALPPDAC